jgi:acetyl-CoA synthetase
MMLDKYLSKVEFDSYDDLKENFKINIPANFNFAFDVVDRTAEVSRQDSNGMV